MALVTRAELQATLNIGTLYANEVLDQVIASAENTVLALLVRDRNHVAYCEVTVVADDPAVGTTVVMTTVRPHGLLEGQQVRVAEFPRTGFTNLLLNVTSTPAADRFVGEATTVFEPAVGDNEAIVPNGVIYLESARLFYDDIPEVREAALAIAVDIFQSRVAPGGQIQGVDFTPGPYRLGRSLFTRVSGLLARWTDTGSLVG